MLIARQLSLLLLPIGLEAIFLHWGIKHALGGNYTVAGPFARHVFAPLLFGLSLAFAVAQRQHPLGFHLKPRLLVINLVFLSLALLYLYYFDSTIAWLASATLRVGVIFLLGFGTLGTAAFLWVSPSEIRARVSKLGPRMAYGLAALLFALSYPFVVERTWRTLAIFTSHLSYILLKLLGVSVTLGWVKYPREQGPQILHEKLGVDIFAPCSGIEGIFFFLFSFCVWQLVITRSAGLRRALKLVASGVVMMVALNAVRIVFFFLIALWLELRYGGVSHQRFLFFAFHGNLGWLLYFIAITLFLILTDEKRRSEREASSG